MVSAERLMANTQYKGCHFGCQVLHRYPDAIQSGNSSPFPYKEVQEWGNQEEILRFFPHSILPSIKWEGRKS